MTAVCSVCGLGTPIRIANKAGSIRCLNKHRAERKEWAKARPKQEERRRKERLKAKYGLTLQDYEAMRERQEGRCLICQKLSDLLVVDHCHETGRVRGLLCRSCNLALGYLEDDPRRAIRAARYVMNSENSEVSA
jgi:N12 class adenine-specific DNA methylase